MNEKRFVFVFCLLQLSWKIFTNYFQTNMFRHFILHSFDISYWNIRLKNPKRGLKFRKLLEIFLIKNSWCACSKWNYFGVPALVKCSNECFLQINVFEHSFLHSNTILNYCFQKCCNTDSEYIILFVRVHRKTTVRSVTELSKSRFCRKRSHPTSSRELLPYSCLGRGPFLFIYSRDGVRRR